MTLGTSMQSKPMCSECNKTTVFTVSFPSVRNLTPCASLTRKRYKTGLGGCRTNLPTDIAFQTRFETLRAHFGRSGNPFGRHLAGFGALLGGFRPLLGSSWLSSGRVMRGSWMLLGYCWLPHAAQDGLGLVFSRIWGRFLCHLENGAWVLETVAGSTRRVNSCRRKFQQLA